MLGWSSAPVTSASATNDACCLAVFPVPPEPEPEPDPDVLFGERTRFSATVRLNGRCLAR